MQSDVAVTDSVISGTLNKVTGYTGFSDDPELQNGNYLALKVIADSDATVTAKLNGGSGGTITLPSSRNVVFRITDKDTQTITFAVTRGSMTTSKTFRLTGLTLAN